MMIQFFIPMKKIPTVTAQQKRVTVVNGKPRFYDSESIKKARMTFQSRLAEHAPTEPLNAPVRVVMKWLHPVTNAKGDGEYKISKPDVDNASKIVLDEMTKLGFWNDDANVSSLTVEKFHSDVVGIYFEIYEL